MTLAVTDMNGWTLMLMLIFLIFFFPAAFLPSKCLMPNLTQVDSHLILLL